MIPPPPKKSPHLQAGGEGELGPKQAPSGRAGARQAPLLPPGTPQDVEFNRKELKSTTLNVLFFTLAQEAVSSVTGLSGNAFYGGLLWMAGDERNFPVIQD